MDDSWLTPRVAELRQRIDRMTSMIPDRKLTRTEVATLAMAMQPQGMAIAVTEIASTPLTAEHADAAAAKLRSLCEDLIDSLGAQGNE